MTKAMTLSTESVKETINSLCLSLHNNRPITFKSTEAAGTYSGRIIRMDHESFEIDSKDWLWEYSEITAIELN